MALTKVPSNLDATVATTQSASDNSTNVATTAYVTTAISNLSDSAPAALNTLNEIAAALGDDANYASTTTAAIAAKAPLATPQFTNRVGIGVAAHGTAGLNITSTAQHMRLNNGSELGILSLESDGALRVWSHGDSSNEIEFYQGSGSGYEVAKFTADGWFNSSANVATDNPPDSAGLFLGWNHSNGAGESHIVFNKGAGSLGGLRFSDNSGNGSLVELMRLENTGALGIGKIPPPGLHTSWSHLFLGEKGSVISEKANSGGLYGTWLTDNMYVKQSTGAFANITADESSAYRQEAGIHQWFTQASGSADAAITLSEKMRIDSSGNVGIGAPSISSWTRLQVAGTAGAQDGAKQALYIQSPTTTANEGVGIRMSAASGSHEAVGIIGMVNNASGNAGAMTFHTYNLGATIPEVMRLDNKGNLGLGVTPEANWRSSVKALDLGATGAFWDGHNYSIFANNIYEHTDTDRKHKQAGFGSSIEQYLGTISFNRTTSGSADAVISGSNTMFLNTNGNIGINTTNPQGYLHINGTSDNQLFLDSNSASANTGIFFRENGSNKGELYWRGASDDFRYYNYDRSHVQWVMTAGGKHEFYGKHQGDSVGHFLFTNNGLGDAGSTNCSLVVQNGGTFIQVMGWTTLGARIGTRTGGWNSNSGGDVYFTRQDATSIKLASSGPQLSNGTAISSDERLKENITNISNGQLAKINALTPRNFTWKDSRKTGTHEGFIAQEVEAVIPEAVYEDNWAPDPDDTSRDFDGDIKLIKHEVINARLIKAVQELSSELEAAKARIAALEG